MIKYLLPLLFISTTASAYIGGEVHKLVSVDENVEQRIINRHLLLCDRYDVQYCPDIVFGNASHTNNHTWGNHAWYSASGVITEYEHDRAWPIVFYDVGNILHPLWAIGITPEGVAAHEMAHHFDNEWIHDGTFYGMGFGEICDALYGAGCFTHGALNEGHEH